MKTRTTTTARTTSRRRRAHGVRSVPLPAEGLLSEPLPRWPHPPETSLSGVTGRRGGASDLLVSQLPLKTPRPGLNRGGGRRTGTKSDRPCGQRPFDERKEVSPLRRPPCPLRAGHGTPIVEQVPNTHLIMSRRWGCGQRRPACSAVSPAAGVGARPSQPVLKLIDVRQCCQENDVECWRWSNGYPWR